MSESNAKTCPRCHAGKIFPDTHYCALCGEPVWYEELAPAEPDSGIQKQKVSDADSCLPREVDPQTLGKPDASADHVEHVRQKALLRKALEHYARRYDKDGKCWNWNNYACDSYSGEVSHFDWHGDEQDDPWEIAERVLFEHRSGSPAASVSAKPDSSGVTTETTWICGCGTVNGVNLGQCRACNRTTGESIEDCQRSQIDAPTPSAPSSTEQKGK